MVELLFGYLPAVNRLRRSHLLALEALESTPKSTAKLAVRETVEESSDNPVDRMIDGNFSAIQLLEQNIKSDNSIDRTYAALLSKERSRLEDWRHDRSINRVKISGSQEVLKMQEQLRSILEPLLENSEFPKTPHLE